MTQSKQQAPSARWYATVALALCMWREARGEGLEGMRAVAHVVRNRHLGGWGSLVQVITAPKQFSSMSLRGDTQTTAWPSDTDGSFAAALLMADQMLSGTPGPDPTGGALYYENKAVATSEWFIKNVRNRMRQTATIGNHTFYAP